MSFAFPVKVVSHSQWQDKFSMFRLQYIDDLPEPGHLPIELKMWEEYWSMYKGVPPNSLSTLLLVTDKMTFPNIYMSLKIAATIPVTTCEYERSISVLRRLKTYLRNTTRQNRMNGLALLHVHRDIDLNINYIIDQFARKHPRCMKLLDILNDEPR